MSSDVMRVLLYCGVLVFAAPTLLVFIMVYRYVRLHFLLRDLPGPSPSFYFGNAQKYLIDEKGERIPFLYMQKNLQKQYGAQGDLVKFSVGSVPMVEMYDSRTVKEVMSSKFQKFRNRPYMIVPLVGKRNASFRESLLFTSSKSWASMRAATMPLFHTAALNAAAADVERHMRPACDRVAGAAAAAAAAAGSATGEAPIDILKIVQAATLAVSFKVSFGTDMPSGADADGGGGQHELEVAARTFFDSMQVSGGLALFAANLPRVLRPLICHLSYLFSGHSKPLNASLDVIFAATQQLIEAFAEAHPELGVDASADPDILQGGFGRKVLPEGTVPSEHSLIAHLLRSQNKASGHLFTPLEALPQAWMMLVAGYETTAVTVAQTLFCVARCPTAEEALLREIDGHSADSVPTQDTLCEWPFALACVKEALRLYPVTLPVRMAGKGATVAGRPVPEGTGVHACTYAMHTDPRIWPEPDEFQPQRFVNGLSPEAEAAYHPFGVGPRSCIGYRLGLLEAVIAIVMLHRRFIFRVSEARHPGGHIRFRMTITMSPVDGIWVTAVER